MLYCVWLCTWHIKLECGSELNHPWSVIIHRWLTADFNRVLHKSTELRLLLILYRPSLFHPPLLLSFCLSICLYLSLAISGCIHHFFFLSLSSCLCHFSCSLSLSFMTAIKEKMDRRSEERRETSVSCAVCWKRSSSRAWNCSVWRWGEKCREA